MMVPGAWVDVLPALQRVHGCSGRCAGAGGSLPACVPLLPLHGSGCTRAGPPAAPALAHLPSRPSPTRSRPPAGVPPPARWLPPSCGARASPTPCPTAPRATNCMCQVRAAPLLSWHRGGMWGGRRSQEGRGNAAVRAGCAAVGAMRGLERLWAGRRAAAAPARGRRCAGPPAARAGVENTLRYISSGEWHVRQ